MKKIALCSAVLFLALAFNPPLLHAQQAGPSQGWYCPWQGRGFGWMRHRAGMNGRWGWGCMRGQGMRFTRGQPLNKDQAKQLLGNYLQERNNPNLKLGGIVDKGDVFEATITNKDGSPVEKIQVDKNTGWFRNVS